MTDPELDALVARADAASRDDRLADGMLYRQLADAITALRARAEKADERARNCAVASLGWENRYNLKEADFMRLKVEAEEYARQLVDAEAHNARLREALVEIEALPGVVGMPIETEEASALGQQVEHAKEIARLAAVLARAAPSQSDAEAVTRLIDAFSRWFDHGQKPTADTKYRRDFDEAKAAILARMRPVPDELINALATLFHGYCRLDAGDQKFRMVVSPDWTWEGRHPNDCVKAWAVVHAAVYPDVDAMLAQAEKEAR